MLICVILTYKPQAVKTFQIRFEYVKPFKGCVKLINERKNSAPATNTPHEFPFQLLAATYGIADARTSAIQRSDYECCTVEFVYEGSGYLDINGHSSTPGANSVYILHKHSTHNYRPEKQNPWKKIFFVIDGELMEYLFRIYHLDQVYHIPDCPQIRKHFEEMMLLKHSAGATIHHQASIIFHRMLEEAYAILYDSSSDRVPAEVLQLKSYLDDSIERKVNLEDFCQEAHRSSAHMIRQFKAHFGATPYCYLMEKRIEAARLLLRHSALSVKEVAARLKFSDQYYFSNYFKRKTGLSPKKYKK